MSVPRKNRGSKRERGVALLMVIFAMTLMLIAVMTAAPGILANRKRETEKEMIWRGNQYVRGIKMYYRKNGKFPTSLDDLLKPQAANVRFMRQAYKDPMNKEDGTWRLIYVGPSGQLIGSLKPQPALTLPTGIPGGSGIGTPAANSPGAGINTSNNPGAFGATGNASGQFGTNGQQGAVGQQGTAGTAQTTGTGVPTETDSNGNPPLPETGTILGGNIIGVGSKALGRSVIWYKDAKNYRLFEFIWDPNKDTLQIGQPQNIPGATQPGAIPGTQPGTQQSPFGNPGTGGTQNPPTNPPPSNPPQQNPPLNQ